MSVLRRHFRPNQICFITSVTHDRRPILVDNADLFWSVIERVQSALPFDLYAWVLLPDHVHLLMGSPRGDFSVLMQRVKVSFSERYRRRNELRRGQVWQPRFWDHIVRDEVDLARHADYIHYNPVKHGLASDPFQWLHSSLRRDAQGVERRRDWMQIQKIAGREFGE